MKDTEFGRGNDLVGHEFIFAVVTRQWNGPKYVGDFHESISDVRRLGYIRFKIDWSSSNVNWATTKRTCRNCNGIRTKRFYFHLNFVSFLVDGFVKFFLSKFPSQTQSLHFQIYISSSK